jgi:hypothetical protein
VKQPIFRNIGKGIDLQQDGERPLNLTVRHAQMSGFERFSAAMTAGNSSGDIA